MYTACSYHIREVVSAWALNADSNKKTSMTCNSACLLQRGRRCVGDRFKLRSHLTYCRSPGSCHNLSCRPGSPDPSESVTSHPPYVLPGFIRTQSLNQLTHSWRRCCLFLGVVVNEAQRFFLGRTPEMATIVTWKIQTLSPWPVCS
jgi:hypothetical protein